MAAHHAAPIRRLAILYAMEAEAQPLARRLALQPSEPPDRAQTVRRYSGSLHGLTIELLTNGVDPRFNVDRIGTDGATLAAYLAVTRLAPDLLLNAGTCGGFRFAGGCVGDLLVGQGNALFHDRRIPIPGMDRLGLGEVPLTPAPQLVTALNARAGTISTGNSLDCLPHEMDFFRARNVVAKDMEAASIAQIALQHGVPFVPIKAITDLVDHPEPTHEVFLRNLARVADDLNHHVERAVRWLAAGRSVETL